MCLCLCSIFQFNKKNLCKFKYRTQTHFKEIKDFLCVLKYVWSTKIYVCVLYLNLTKKKIKRIFFFQYNQKCFLKNNKCVCVCVLYFNLTNFFCVNLNTEHKHSLKKLKTLLCIKICVV